MKKSVLLMAAVVTLFSSLFISCGEKDDAEKYTPQEQFNLAVSKSYVEDSKLFTQGLAQARSQIQFSNYGESCALKVSFGDPLKQLVTSILNEEAYMNLDLSWCNSIQLETIASITDKANQLTLKANLNNVDILSVNLYEDPVNAAIYLNVPELVKRNYKVSERELGFSVKDIADTYLAQVSFLSSVPEDSVFTGFVEELMNAFISPITNVERSTEDLSAGLAGSKNVTAKYTVLTTVLDEETGEKMAESLSSTVRNSANLSAILNWIIPAANQVSGERIRVKDVINEMADEIEDSFSDMFYDTSVKLSLYVDANSKIAGMRLVGENGAEIYYAMPQVGKTFGYTCSIYDGSEPIMALNGYGTYAAGKMTGDFKLNAEGEDVVSFSTKDLDVAGMKSCKFNGAITVSPKPEMRQMVKSAIADETYLDNSVLSFIDNLNLEIRMNQKDYTSYSAELAFTDGKSDFIGFSATSNIKKPSEIVIPSTDIMVVDSDSVYDYSDLLEGVSIAAVTENLKKAKVPSEYTAPLDSIDSDMLEDIVDEYLY